MVFIQRFTINDRLRWIERVIVFNFFPGLRDAGDAVAVLLHVEGEPRIRVKPFGRSTTAIGMKGDENAAIVLTAVHTDGDTLGHGAPDILHSVGLAIATENPNDAFVAEALTQKFAVGFG